MPDVNLGRSLRPVFSRICARVTLLAVAALCLSACASRPYATLLPVEGTVPGTHQVDMLVATTRQASAVPGVVFSGDRGEDVSLENIVVSIPPDSARRPGAVVFPRRNPGNPATEFVTTKVERIDRKGALTWYKRVVGPKRRVLIFVHGFNSSYEEAVFRFAQIRHDMGTDAAPILFTWPSQGSVFGYLYDRESAAYSRTALENLIKVASASPDVSEITVMAHSMGGWLTMEALRQMAIRDKRLPAKLTNIVLASPDLDVDVFRQQLDEIGPEQGRITIFTSQDDRALLVSRRLSGGVQRLGAVDLTQRDVQAAFEKRGINVIDLTSIKAGDSLNHTKFAESADVVAAIGQRLMAGQEISNDSLGFGETIGAAAIGTAQGVGSAIGAAASVPGALVDQGARRNLDTQLRNVGRNLGGTLQTVTGQ